MQIFPKKAKFGQIASSPRLFTPTCKYFYTNIFVIFVTFCNSEYILRPTFENMDREWLRIRPKPPLDSLLESIHKKFTQSPSTPPLGSTCQDILVLFAPLLACRMAKGGRTSILVPFNLLLTSCIAFCPHAFDPSHSFCSSKLAPESSNIYSFCHLSVEAT